LLVLLVVWELQVCDRLLVLLVLLLVVWELQVCDRLLLLLL
jgi:hypothetical protein